MQNIYKVVQQSKVFSVQSQKAENGQVTKCTIVLQEMGGKYENQYVATLLGDMAEIIFTQGEMIVAALHFSAREYNGNLYQDILVTDLRRFK